MTEEQNIETYKNFITTAINNGNHDMVVSYEDWLEDTTNWELPIHEDVGRSRSAKAIRSQLLNTHLEYQKFYKAINRINKVTTVSVDKLRKIFKNV